MPYFPAPYPSHEALPPMTPSEQLLEYACALDSVMDDMRAQSNALYEWLQAHPVQGASCVVDSERNQRESIYWATQKRLERTVLHQDEVVLTIEQLEAGVIDEDAALSVMVQEPVADGAKKESKRRAAIRKQHEKDSALDGADRTYLSIALGGLSSLASDARRITTGRDRTRLVATTALHAASAPGLFFEVTADTHGGKSRHNGKNGKYYTAQSGKRIRKR